MTYRHGMPFAFWCHKVLPLVYDESLSYYEFLCKVAKILQEVMEHDIEQDESIKQNSLAIEEINTGLEGIRSDITEIQRINRLQELAITGNTDDINRLSADIAKQYNESESYDNGDFAMLGKELYKKIRNTGVFDDDWVKVNIADELLSMGASIRALSNDAQSARNDINEIFRCLASVYNSNEVYYAGNVVRYNGEIYVCTPDGESTTGTFNPNDWDSTNLGNLIGELNEKTEVLTGRIQGVSGRVDEVLACIAPYYDNGTSYDVGDFCTYLDKFWRCVSATSGAFDTSNWESVSVVDVMGSGGGGSGDISFADWNANTYYVWGDIVKYNGAIYICKSSDIHTFHSDSWGRIDGSESVEYAHKMLWFEQEIFVNDGTFSSDVKRGEMLLENGSESANKFNPFFNVANEDINAGDTAQTGYAMSTSVVKEINNINEKVSNFSVDVFDTSKAYKVGELVYAVDTMSSDQAHAKLWRCISDTVPQQAFSPTNEWVETSIVEELIVVKNAVINMNLYNGNVLNRYHTTVTEGA